MRKQERSQGKKIFPPALCWSKENLDFLPLETKITMPLKVGYWKIRGLAAPLRMVCAYAGCEFESVEYEAKSDGKGGWDLSEWFSVKPGLQERNAMMNLPYVEDGDILITQSNACLKYLGRKLNMLGDGPAEACATDQLMDQIMDLRNAAVGVFYGGWEKADAHVDKAVAGHYKKLEGFMTQQGKAFLASDAPTVADFHLWEMMDQHERLANKMGKPSPLADFAGLRRIYEALRGDPKLAGYFSSAMFALPVNNKMAAWGSDENDGR